MPDAYPFDRLCIVLVSTRNPLNIGAAARAMCNFCVSDLRVVHPYDPAFREARSAVGAASLLGHAREFDTVADAVADCTLVVATAAVTGRRELHHPLHTLADGAPLILAELHGAKSSGVAILFGSEKTGLSNQDLSYCHWQMYIPTHPGQPSMNLGQAVAVCLYELTRGSLAVQGDLPHAAPASAGDLDRLTSVLLGTLESSGYFEAQMPRANRIESLRQLVMRLNPPAEDAAKWLGMLRQIAWKLRADKKES